jgi:rod shape-determining protein MreC
MGGVDDMRKKSFGLQKRFVVITILIFIVVVVAILSYNLKKDRQQNVVESIIKDAAVEIEKIVIMPVNFVKGILTDYLELQNVKKENDILKTNVEELDSLKTFNSELIQEIEELKDELNIEHVLSDYEYLNATVVNRNTNYWYNTLTIDKGKNNGVEVGMAVINSKGLVGKVINVSNFTADIRLITTSDTNNKISVTITNGNNKVTGLINGYSYENDTIEVEGVSNTEEVKVGDMVYTSGLGGVFPSGILVGTVESISTDSFGLAKIINVKSSVSFDNINYVSILKRSDID